MKKVTTVVGKTVASPKALSLMSQNLSVKDRAEAYFESVRRNIQRDIIDGLIAKKEELNDKLFELTNFTLETNLNAGLNQMTKDICEKRFKDVIETEFQIFLVSRELEVKQASFDKYFK